LRVEPRNQWGTARAIICLSLPKTPARPFDRLRRMAIPWSAVGPRVGRVCVALLDCASLAIDPTRRGLYRHSTTSGPRVCYALVPGALTPLARMVQDIEQATTDPECCVPTEEAD
jgi:hypothetical protein